MKAKKIEYAIVTSHKRTAMYVGDDDSGIEAKMLLFYEMYDRYVDRTKGKQKNLSFTSMS